MLIMSRTQEDGLLAQLHPVTNGDEVLVGLRLGLRGSWARNCFLVAYLSVHLVDTWAR